VRDDDDDDESDDDDDDDRYDDDGDDDDDRDIDLCGDGDDDYDNNNDIVNEINLICALMTIIVLSILLSIMLVFRCCLTSKQSYHCCPFLLSQLCFLLPAIAMVCCC
jgi:hypothetical protein